jgi:hypothetical protein
MKWTAETRQRLHLFRTTERTDPPDAHRVLSAQEAWDRLRELVEKAPPAEVIGYEAEKDTVERVEQELQSSSPPGFDGEVELRRAMSVLERLPRPTNNTSGEGAVASSRLSELPDGRFAYQYRWSTRSRVST